MPAKVSGALDDLQYEVDEACVAITTDIYPSRRRTKFFTDLSKVIRNNCKVLENLLR